MSINVAIDGPAGAGKSTIAKRLARELGYIYVDTGAMYRALGYYFLKNKIDIMDETAVEDIVSNADVSITYEDGIQQVLLNGENVTGYLRQEEVGNAASMTSAYGCVRKHLLKLQQDLAASENVIMDGRDIGTCVLPNADVKIFLTASVDTRGKRRYLELLEKNEPADLEEIKKAIAERDERDMNREIAPLKRADDAILLDSSEMTIDEVIETTKQIIEEKL